MTTTAPPTAKVPATAKANPLAGLLAGALAKGGVTNDEIPTFGLHLSTGIPNLDYIISGKYRGGGFQSGRMIEIAGPPSAGKTLIAQHVMKEAQKLGGAANFRDHERTFDPNLYESFGGDITPGIFTYSRPRSFEESIDGAVDWMESIRSAKVIPFEAPLVCVFDSLAAMVPAEKLDREVVKNGKTTKADPGAAMNMRQKVALATATSQEFPAFATFVEENNILAIFLNQIRTKPGVTYGDPRYTPGGDSMPFYASVRMWLNATRMVDKATRQVIGQSVTAETVKNKTHKPFQKQDFIFKFKEDGTGFIDIIDTMIGHLLEIKLIPQAGAYIVWDGKNRHRAELVRMLTSDPTGLDQLIDIAEKGTN